MEFSEATPLPEVTLSAWLNETGTKVEGLASRLGVSAATISRIANRKQTASLELALALHEATGRRVPVATMVKSSEAA